MVRRELIFRRVHGDLWLSDHPEKKQLMRSILDQPRLMIYQWVRWRHDVMFAELGWCPQISNILWLPSVDIRMLRDHFKTWAPEDSEAFAPWFFGRIWPLLNPWNRWNLWVQWWMDLQSRHKVEKKKVHDVAFNGKHLFVIPTSQLKTATHIFRNLNRWKIDRKGHDLDLARQRAAGCGCCWSLGRCTTGQACQPLFNFGFVFFSHRF